MQKAKRWMAAAMATTMTAAVLSGCGGNTDAKDQGSSNSSEAGQTTDGAADGSEATGGLTYNGQDVSEPVELVMYYIGDKPEDEDKVLEQINGILKEKINATLTLKNMSMSDYNTKYSLTLAGGENIDLIYTSTWAFYQSEATKGAFAEVTDDVINNYMPLHKENQAEASWGQAKIGGKVYFVPGNMANVSMNAVLIRGDLREKYGIESIDSMEDLEAYYDAVLADPDSGVQFPYAASQNNNEGRYAMFFAGNDFVRIEGAIADYITYKFSEDFTPDDLVWIYGTEEYLAYAKEMKEWADKGFWSKSAIANATDTKDAFLNGTSASYVWNLGSVGAVASQVETEHPEWKPEIYDITPDAHRFFAAYTGDGVAVVANSKHQDRAFMALDLLKFDKELYDLQRFGIEGVHYEKASDTTWLPAADAQKYPFGNGFSWGLKNSSFDMVREDQNKDQTEIGAKWTENAVESPTAAFSFDDTNVKNELANLKSIYTQYVPLLDLGLVEDVEATLAEFQKQAEAAGLDKILEEAKTQLTAYMASIE